MSVVVTAFKFGVTEVGLNAQLANAGMFAQAKLTGAVKEPWGVIVSVIVPDSFWLMIDDRSVCFATRIRHW